LVATALSQGASIGTVNLAEVAAKLAEVGIAEPAIRQAIGSLGLDVHDFDAELAYISGMLRATTRQLGLSLGDRACLALGRRLGVPVVTADRTWLGLGFDVQVIR
jgi:PIN domain nuclease of toxin-antitoxin system